MPNPVMKDGKLENFILSTNGEETFRACGSQYEAEKA